MNVRTICVRSNMFQGVPCSGIFAKVCHERGMYVPEIYKTNCASISVRCPREAELKGYLRDALESGNPQT